MDFVLSNIVKEYEGIYIYFLIKEDLKRKQEQEQEQESLKTPQEIENEQRQDI